MSWHDHERYFRGQNLSRPREVQTELVEWEEVSPRSYVLKMRTWDVDTVRREEGNQGTGVGA